MDADERRFVLKDETRLIIGCAMEVLNALGHGLLEKPYERALALELASRSVPFQTQKAFDVVYKGTCVGTYVPDLIVFGQIIVELKCVERIGPIEMAQTLNYLRIAKLPVGLILNFKRPKLEWERVALSA